MLRAVVIAALIGFSAPALADPAEDALVNCLIAKTTVAMALEGQELASAYPAAWDACEREADAVPNVLAAGADNLPYDYIDEYAYHTLQDIADRLLQPGFTLQESEAVY